MTALHIPCPKCGSELRLPDRKLLGKIGKCPKCTHRFVLQEPDEVSLELADVPANPTPRVGVAAQWVPDAAPTSGRATGGANLEERGGFSGIAADAGSERVQQIRRRRRQSHHVRNFSLLAGLIVAVVAAGVFVLPGIGKSPQPVAPGEALVSDAAEELGDNDGGAADAVEPTAKSKATSQTQVAADGKPSSPTHGSPIELRFIPPGARIVINIRPAELWKAGRLGDGELIACLGPFGTWLGNALKELCLEEPAKIEEALICFIPGPRGSPPDVAAVVHLKQEAKKSDLLEKFDGKRMEEQSRRPYYVNAEKAYVLEDLRTYAIAPSKMANEMVEAADVPATTDIGLEALLAQTDRNRLLTIALTPDELKLDGEFLVPPNAQDLIRNLVEWLSNDDEVEAVAWSLHLGDQLYSELLLRNKHIVKPFQLQRAMATKLGKTPELVLETIQQMNPPDFGKRRVIGRVPAMVKTLALATQVAADNKKMFVSLTTALPDKAAPNLALGILLAWDESTRTSFGVSSGSESKGNSGAKVPDLIADRLKTKIDVDFRREPLFSAFEFVGGEAKFEINIEGDSLKLSGYTKNMIQTFKMDGVPATVVIQEILKKYEQMVIVVDEQKKLVTVTTKAGAEAKGQKPFAFAP